ncbi:class I SAM-dependent methyltransferase [Amycolatopsis pigmentata]|uniref:Class I SAM-dependent methyltransferase n=1 Tax=Amycolatopsis pigmentata TaxID=450801 RepID=A0ABW5G3I2_9PSEU
MPFNHNHHYHPLLLRQVPEGAKTALDVGCGTGLFARRLASGGLDVDAMDPAGDVLEVARALGSPGPGRITYRHEDVTRAALGTYDFISAIASIHHVPFETVTALWKALAPGGVLVILGLAKPRSVPELVKWEIVSPPLNLAARIAVAVGERLNGGRDPAPGPPVADWKMTMPQVRRESASLLPGRTVRTLFFWRYLLICRRD